MHSETTITSIFDFCLFIRSRCEHEIWESKWLKTMQFLFLLLSARWRTQISTVREHFYWCTVYCWLLLHWTYLRNSCGQQTVHSTMENSSALVYWLVGSLARVRCVSLSLRWENMWMSGPRSPLKRKSNASIRIGRERERNGKCVSCCMAFSASTLSRLCELWSKWDGIWICAGMKRATLWFVVNDGIV